MRSPIDSRGGPVAGPPDRVWEDTVYAVVKRLVFDSRWWVFCAAVNLFVILRSGI